MERRAMIPHCLVSCKSHENQMQRRLSAPLYLYYQILDCETLPVESVLCLCISCRVMQLCSVIRLYYNYVSYTHSWGSMLFFFLGLKSFSSEFAVQISSSFNRDIFMQYFVVFLISSCTSLQECAMQANLILIQLQSQTLGVCAKKSQYKKLSCL